MPSHGSSLDASDKDTALAALIAEKSNPFEEDVIPFPRAQPDIEDDSDTTGSDSQPTPRKPSLPRSKAKKARKAAHQIQTSKPSLRPANDILFRLRHDPALNESDYIVGYHDRHADVMEMDVSVWKGGGDVTDEEWIPQHRILYFRKKGDKDGLKIWDRAARLDRVFGSGVVGSDQANDEVQLDRLLTVNSNENQDVVDDLEKAASRDGQVSALKPEHQARDSPS